MVTREQVRMARAALHWTGKKLSQECGISEQSINKYENGGDAYAKTLMSIRRTFEDNGIVFIEEDETYGPGVRLRRRRM